MDITVFMKQHLDNQATIIELLKGGAAPGKTTTAAGKTAAGAKTTTSKPKVTKSQATAAVNKVKEMLGAPAAREVLSSCGVGKLAEMAEANYEEVYAAANAALEAGSGEEETNDEDI